MANVGDRVGAILSANGDEIRLLGYGVYEGEQLRPDWEELTEAYLPYLRQNIAEDAQKSLEDVMEQERGLSLALAKLTGKDAPSEDEVRAAAEKLYAVYQERAGWSDEQIVEWMKQGSVLRNPCIRLDDGRVVWGFQCWWGSEEYIRRVIGDRTVVVVDINNNPIEEGAQTV